VFIGYNCIHLCESDLNLHQAPEKKVPEYGDKYLAPKCFLHPYSIWNSTIPPTSSTGLLMGYYILVDSIPVAVVL